MVLVGNQGWEYVGLGRAWQFLMVAGSSAWFALLWTLVCARSMADAAVTPVVRTVPGGGTGNSAVLRPSAVHLAKDN
ncbi:MAG: hypothetical protein NVS2B4_00590 [Ramlibacter sp.]